MNQNSFWSTVWSILKTLFAVLFIIVSGLIRFCLEIYAIATDNDELKANLRANELRKELPEMTAQEVLKRYSLFGNNCLKPKTEGEYNVIKKLENSPQTKISNLLSDKEIEWLVIMILRFLGLID